LHLVPFDAPTQLFNATALLLGIGMLSEPLAFSYAGWICGTLLMISYGYVTCYTYVFPSLPFPFRRFAILAAHLVN
jgi:hypothetical protein